MSNIFDKLKTFSFLSEKEKPIKPIKTAPAKTAAPSTEGLTNDLLMIELTDANINPEEFTKVIRSHNDSSMIIGVPDKANSYFITIDKESDPTEVINYLSSLNGAKKIKLHNIDSAAISLFKSAYNNKLKKDIAQGEEILKSSPELDMRAAASLSKAWATNRKWLRFVDKKITGANDKEKQQQWNDEKKALNTKLNELDEQIKGSTDRYKKEVANLFNSIDYRNPETALFQLSRIAATINIMKKEGTLSEYWNNIYQHKIIQVKEKLKLPDEAFKNGIADGVGETLAYYVTKFMYTEQKDEKQLSEEYGMVMQALDAQRRQLKPEDYEKLKNLIIDSMKTKVAIMKSIKEQPNIPVDTGSADKDKSDTKPISVSPGEGNANEYEVKVKIPLNKVVTITDVEKFKVVKGKSGNAENEMMRKSILARSEVSLFNLMGYNPKGDAATVIAAYDPLRRQVGEVTETFAKNTLGLLGSVMGKNGTALGQGIGSVLKHELIGNPSEINPALAQGETWLRGRFNLFKVMKTEPGMAAAASKGLDKSVGKLVNEDAAPAAAASAAPTPASTPGVAPGGDGLNMPGMISGMGDPIPATKDKPGSGDNFNPEKKKKIKRVNEHVFSYKQFMDALYNNK